MLDDSQFKWLPGYEPGRAAYRAQTRLQIAARAHAVWDQLIDANSWPDWFTMSRDVVLPVGKSLLESDISFQWTIQGVRFTSTIYQFEPCHRLAWRSFNRLMSTCHIWALEEQDGSTTVVTDETQRGILPTFLGFLVRPKLQNGQQVWVKSLAARASLIALSATSQPALCDGGAL